MAKKVIDSTYLVANLQNLVSDFLDFRYLKVVSELPASANSDIVFLYVGETIDTEQVKRYKGGLYNYNDGWVEIPNRLSAEVVKKQNKTLETALVVSGTSYTTVEDTLSALNNSKLNVVATEPSEHADGDIIMYVGAATENLPDKGIYVYDASSSKWNNQIIFGQYAKGTATTLDIGRNSLSTTGEYSSAEGYDTAASGRYSHSEGNSTEATAESAHAEGQETTSRGYNAHSEGNRTDASGNYSHAEGQYSMATGNSDHAEGYYTEASGGASHAEGDNTEASGSSAHAEGEHSTASGRASHVEGYYNIAQEMYAHAEGGANTASGVAAHVEGINNTASGARAHAEGGGNTASAESSHAEGGATSATAKFSHAEGSNVDSNGTILEDRTYTIDDDTSVTVTGSTATGISSHAEGVQSLAYGYASHAQNFRTLASGDYAHAEGIETNASGVYSHAEGMNAVASGQVSHAQNYYTVAGYNYQTAMGHYNDNKSTNLLEVGNGGNNNRSNAMEVTADGDLLIKNGGVSLYGLDVNKEVLGAKNLLDDTNPIALYNLEQSGNTFTNASTKTTRNKIKVSYYYNATHSFAPEEYTEFGIGANKFEIHVPINTIAILIAFAGTNIKSGAFSIKYPFKKSGTFNLSFEMVGNDASVVGGFIIKDLMVTLPSETNLTYTPYAMGNQELTSSVNTLNSDKDLLGVKNLLPLTLENLKAINTTGTWSGNAYTLNGVTFTVNTDGLGNVTDITVNGTASDTTVMFMYQTTQLFDCDTILSGCPSDGGSTYSLEVNSNLFDYGEGVTIDANTTITVIRLNVANGATVTDKVFYPMIRLATDPNPTYRPYAMSNQELTQRLLALEARLSSNINSIELEI